MRFGTGGPRVGEGADHHAAREVNRGYRETKMLGLRWQFDCLHVAVLDGCRDAL